MLGLNATECPGKVAADGTITLCYSNSSSARAQEGFWLAYGDAMVVALRDPKCEKSPIGYCGAAHS